MADPDPIEKAALERMLRAARGQYTETPAAAAPPSGRPLVPDVPIQKRPDVATAKLKLEDAARERFQLSMSEADAAFAAQQASGAQAPVPDEVTTDWWDQLARALLPQQVARDVRGMSAAEIAKNTVAQGPTLLRQALLPAPEVFDLAEGLTGKKIIANPLFDNPVFRDPSRSILTPDEELGTPTENGALYLMRVIGSTAEALVTETVERVPTPDILGAADTAAGGGSTSDVFHRFFTPSSIGAQLLSFEPGTLQRVRSDNPVEDWSRGVLERIERGGGFQDDLALAASRKLGPEWETAGWRLGLAISILTNWEGAALKGPRVAIRVGESARALEGLVPEGLTQGDHLWQALKGNEINAGELLGDVTAAEVEAGRISAEKLPPRVRAFAEQVAQNKYERSWREILDEDGYGLPPDVSDPAYVAAKQKLTAAQQAVAAAQKSTGAGTPGVDPQSFGPRVVVNKTGVTKQREVLPAFEAGKKPTWTAADFWNRVAETYRRLAREGKLEPLGYHIPHGEGFRRMDDALEQSIDDFEYVLRSRSGDVVEDGYGTFHEVLDMLLKRQLDGDEVWYGTRRPVARWSAKVSATDPKVKLVADYFFSSQVEERVVKLLQGSDPRARPDRLIQQQARAAAAALTATKTAIGHTLVNAITGAPASAVGKARSTTRTADVIREAYALAVRNTLGTDRLKMLPNTAIVAAVDHPRILKRAEEILGFNADHAMEVITGKAQLTPEQAAAWKALAPKMDLAKPSVADWQEAYNKAVGTAAGVLGDVRYRIQGVRPLAERMIAALKDLHVKRGPAKLIGERGRFGWAVTEMARAFSQDVLDRLPEPVKALWKQLRLTIEADSDQLVREIRAAAGKDPETVLIDSLERYHVPHPVELDLAESVITAPKTQMAQEIAELRAQWRGTDRPRWLDHTDDVIYTAGAKRWAFDTQARAAHVAREWMLTNLAVAGKRVGTETLEYQQIAAFSTADMLELYEEFARKGHTGGPILGRWLGQFGVQIPDRTEALVAFTLHTRRQGKILEALDRMVGGGMAVRRSDPRLPALQAMMIDDHRVFNAAAQRWDYKFPEAQLSWARNRLRDWGLEPGAGQQLVTPTGSRSGVLVPQYLRDEAERLLRLGFLSSKDLTPYQVVNRLYRLAKESLTHGLILPNPGHFTGQMLSVMPTLVTTQGLGGALSAMGQLLYKHPAIVGELVRRLGGKGFPLARARSLESEILRGVDGMLTHVDELEEVARRLQIGETRTDFEVADSLKQVLAHTDAGPMAWRMIKASQEWWQHQIRSFAGAFDLNARVAVYVDQVERGIAPEQAALIARQAALDFRDLTPFESKYMRLIFTFYAFMRKNSDAYLRALITHPERVTSQMRLARASLTSSGLTNIELGAMTDSDVARMNVYSDREVVSEDGRVHPLYKMNRVSSSPVGVAEWLGTMRMLMPIPGAYPDIHGLLQSVNPALQTLAILAQGRRLEQTFERPWSNRIPPWMMDIPGGDMLMDAVGAGWEPLGQYDDPLTQDDDATLEAGVPAYWAAGSASNPTSSSGTREAQRVLWQAVMVWISRPAGTLEMDLQAVGLQNTPPNITQTEAFWDAMLGVRHRPVFVESEAQRRQLVKKESGINAATNELRPPEGVGPR